MTEEDLLNEIDLAIKQLKEIKLIKNNLLSQLQDQETIYGEVKLQLERLKDQLRRLRLRTVKYEPTERELEIERFRSVLPFILKG